MNSKEIYELGMKKLEIFDGHVLDEAMQYANSGAKEDVLNTNGCGYYQWIVGVVEELKPKQVVELGGAMGVWALCVLHTLPKNSMLHSITLAEHGLEFSYIKGEHTNLNMIVGSDLELENFKGVELENTDLWFIDAEHTETHLRKELDLYHSFFKAGSIILFDDIHSFGLQPVWDDLKKGVYGEMDCYDATDPLHYTGYGICVKK